MTIQFANMRTWFDKLTPQEQDEIRAIHAGIKVSDRVLPVDHGTSGPGMLDASERAFLAAKDPFFTIRLNDCEMAMLGGGYPLPGSLPIDYMLKWLGFDRAAFSLRPEFLDAVAACPLLALHQMWTPFYQHTAIYLSMLDHSLPFKNGVSAAISYYILPRTLFPFLAGKRVLLIGSEAENLERLWKDPKFLSDYAHFGPIEKTIIAGAVKTPSHPKPDWRCLDSIMDRVKGLSFDVALLGCGGLAKILAFRIWKMNRTALDMGAVFPAMLGGKHRQRPILKDAKWPKADWGVELATKL
jgi:hypothetical protein